MVDDSVVVDDESKIVTKFLLNTCQLKRPTKRHILAAAQCARTATLRSPDDDEADSIPLTTGSLDEFYIQPMLSCFGNIDIIYHRSTVLAIPAGYLPPSQLPAEFHSRVEVFEIVDSEYPGYVYLRFCYLMTENTDTDEYVVAQYLYDRHQCLAHRYVGPHETEIHGPAQKAYAIVLPYTIVPDGMGLSLDNVHSTRCLSWPTQAADWPTRHRNYGWPDSATVDHVVSNGCDVVQIAHRRCRQDKWMNMRQWRLSFSRAEIVLLNSWMPVQQIVYHMLRVFVKTERLTDITDSTGTKMLSNYHIKTMMLWACELKPSSWWIDDLNFVRNCIELLHILADWLRNENCPHYFVNNCNLIDTTLHVEIIASQLVSITESWLSKWFVNNYLRKCAQLCPNRVSRWFDDVSTSMKLQNAVSAVVDWRQKLYNTLRDLCIVRSTAEFYISCTCYLHSLTLRSCDYWINELPNIDSCLCIYFTAVAFICCQQNSENTFQ